MKSRKDQSASDTLAITGSAQQASPTTAADDSKEEKQQKHPIPFIANTFCLRFYYYTGVKRAMFYLAYLSKKHLINFQDQRNIKNLGLLDRLDDTDLQALANENVQNLKTIKKELSQAKDFYEALAKTKDLDIFVSYTKIKTLVVAHLCFLPTDQRITFFATLSDNNLKMLADLIKKCIAEEPENDPTTGLDLRQTLSSLDQCLNNKMIVDGSYRLALEKAKAQGGPGDKEPFVAHEEEHKTNSHRSAPSAKAPELPAETKLTATTQNNNELTTALSALAARLESYSPIKQAMLCMMVVSEQKLQAATDQDKLDIEGLFFLHKNHNFQFIENKAERETLYKYKRKFSSAAVFFKLLRNKNSNDLNQGLEGNVEVQELAIAYLCLQPFEQKINFLSKLNKNHFSIFTQCIKEIQAKEPENDPLTGLKIHRALSDLIPCMNMPYIKKEQARIAQERALIEAAEEKENNEANNDNDDDIAELLAYDSEDDEEKCIASVKENERTNTNEDGDRTLVIQKSPAKGNSDLAVTNSLSAAENKQQQEIEDTNQNSTGNNNCIEILGKTYVRGISITIKSQYNDLKNKLNDAINTIADAKVKKKFEAVRDKITERPLESYDKYYHPAGTIPPALQKTLTAMENTTEVITGDMSIKDYLAYAKTKVEGKPSKLGKALGVLMIAAGLALAVLSGLAFASGGGFVAAGCLAGASAILLGSGFTLFRKASTSGTSKAMKEAGKARKKLPAKLPVPVPGGSSTQS